MRGSSSSREVAQDVGHLVAALAAADVDDHVGVAPLRDLLQEHRLAGAEAARDGGGAPARDGKEEVERPLPGHERSAPRRPLARARNGRGRRTGHRWASPTSSAADAAIESSTPYGARVGEPLEAAGRSGRDEHAVLEARRPRQTVPRRRTGLDLAARPRRAGVKSKRRSRGSVGGRAPGARKSSTSPSRRSMPSKTPPSSPGPELGRQRQAARDDLLARAQAAGVLVDLHRRDAVHERDDLAGEARGADLDEVEHGRAGEARRPRRRARPP